MLEEPYFLLQQTIAVLKSDQLFVRRELAASGKTLIASLVSFRPCLSPPDLRDRPPFCLSPFPAMDVLDLKWQDRQQSETVQICIVRNLWV